MNEIITALIGFFGVIIGVAIQEFRRWRERREFYHSMIFKERLEKHQRAFDWCHKLNVALNSHDATKINKIAKEFREWWNSNCFYLDEKSRKLIIPLINYAYAYARNENGRNKVWDYLNDTLNSLSEGIGVKYLPEMMEEKNDR
jgi:L-2-hydroxyglutarate oxidase LhgO